MVTQNVAEYPSHHVAHRPGSLKLLGQMVMMMHLKENTFLDLGIKVILNIAQHPLHHAIYSPFKVLSCNVKQFGKKIH